MYSSLKTVVQKLDYRATEDYPVQKRVVFLTSDLKRPTASQGPIAQLVRAHA
jgi:hypothetical protein